MSDAIESWGSKLYLNNVAIAEVTKIGGPDAEKTMIEVTHLASPGNIAEWLISKRDAGTLSIEMQWIPNNTTHQALQASFNSLTLDEWKIEWSNGTELGPFDGTVVKLSPAVEVGKQLMCSVEIKVSGEVPGLVEA